MVTETARAEGSLPSDPRLAIGRVARRLRQLVAAEQARDGITFTEMGVLNRLDRDGPASPGSLAGTERVTSQAIAGVVRELEAKGLVRRSPDPADRRRVTVAITAEGRAALADRERLQLRHLHAALSDHFDEAERRRLADAVPLLERLADRL